MIPRRRGCQPSRGGGVLTHDFVKVFENCMKLRTFWSMGEGDGEAPGTPPLDPLLNDCVEVHFFKFESDITLSFIYLVPSHKLLSLYFHKKPKGNVIIQISQGPSWMHNSPFTVSDIGRCTDGVISISDTCSISSTFRGST